MTGTESTRWVALSALGAAMFAIGFSFSAVACGTKDVSVSEAARAAESARAVPAPAASLGSVARVVNSAAALPTPAPSGATAPLAEDKGAGLKVKRLVVTHRIDNREPVTASAFSLGNAPVYAFVEFENTARAARTVSVMFQNEETRATVGHVKLSVPAAQGRFRTWGNTRMIRDAGHWVAIVSTDDGVELGRAPFDVQG